MFKFRILLLAAFPAFITNQCYNQEEVILSNGNSQKLDIETELSELAIKISSDIVSSEHENVVCKDLTCEAPFQTCLETISLIRPDQADQHTDKFENFIPLDFLMSKDHCSFRTIGGQLRLEKKTVCMTYINTLANTLGINLNMSKPLDHFHLVIKNEELTYLAKDEHLDTTATCELTPSLLSLQLLDNELSVMLLKAKHTLDGLLSLLDKTTITEAMMSCKESVSILEKERLLECIKSKFPNVPSVTRSKRGTFLEYIFSNGAEVDTIANNLAGLGTLVNANNQKIAKNEISLAINEKALSQRLQFLDKTVSNNIKKEFGTVLGLQRLQNAFSSEIAYISGNYAEITDIMQLNTEIEKLITVIIKVMQQNDQELCLSLREEFWCIDFKLSSVKIEKTKISLQLQVSKPKSQTSNYVTCQPLLEENKVSILHNRHLVARGDDLIDEDIVINKYNLVKKDYVNKKTRDIKSSELYLDNIFLTESKEEVLISCVKPELLFIADQRVNCSMNPFILKKSDTFAINTARGIVESGRLINFRFDSKAKFIKQVHKIEKDKIKEENRIEPSSNMTGIDLLIEKLREYSVPELAGMSLGAGSILILIFCGVCWGAWCLGIRRCPAKNGESWVHSPPSTPTVVRIADSGSAAREPIVPSQVNNPLIGGGQDQGQALHPALQRFQDQVVSLARLKRDN